MAISTYRVFLMHASSTGSYEKLLDIKSFPDLGGAPEMLETFRNKHPENDIGT